MAMAKFLQIFRIWRKTDRSNIANIYDEGKVFEKSYSGKRQWAHAYKGFGFTAKTIRDSQGNDELWKELYFVCLVKINLTKNCWSIFDTMSDGWILLLEILLILLN